MTFRTALLAASSALFVALAAPAMSAPKIADTATAEDYVANVRQHVVFLDEASRLAAQRSGTDKLKAFAKAETIAEHQTADELKLWETGRSLSAFAPTMLMAAGTIETTADGPDTIMTGRSVAVDPGIEWSHPDPGVAMVSPGVLVMPQLAKLDGEAFDALYKRTQAISLKELAGFYEAYALTGKDPMLRGMAARELPRVKQRLAEIEAL